MNGNNIGADAELMGDQVKSYAPLNLDECQNIGGLSNDEYETDEVMGDMIKVEYIDENEHGEVLRNGIWMQQNLGTRLWRIGRIIKRGELAAKPLQIGKLVRFPSDRGIPCIADGKKYVYLNGERIFEVVKLKAKA